MASPQKENGYVAIATELLEALARIRINGEARQVLDVIIRKTYGFNKKEDTISLSQFVLATGLKKQTIIKALAKLRSMNLITQKDYAIANLYGLNKDFDRWQPLPKKVTQPKKVMTVTQKGYNRNPKRDIQKTVSKDTITKDIITKVIKAKPRKEKMGIITQQDEVTGEITPVMRVNAKGEMEPAVYGNRDIQLSILAFEEHLGGKTDGTQRSEKLYAKHLTDALKKEYPDQDPVELVKHLLKASLLDPFFAKNCTSFRWLYYNKQKVIQGVKAHKSKNPGIIKLYE